MTEKSEIKNRARTGEGEDENEVLIAHINAKEILDSNGKPTIEVELKTNFGKFKASVPSGISTGKYEAVELRDGDGRGVSKAIENIEKIIAPAIEKETFANQKRVDEHSFISTLRYARVVDEVLIQLDATENKSRLGANAILPVSIAVCRAAAAAKNLPLYQYISQLAEDIPPRAMPRPSFNMIEGGKHAENNLAFQEFMVVPQKDSFGENFTIGKEIYKLLGEILKAKFGKKNVGLSREGAFTAPIEKITDAFDLILEAAGKVGHKNDIRFAIDAAASEFYENGNYKIDGKTVSGKELLGFYENLTEKYPIILIEDPFYEENFDDFTELKNEMGERVIIFGDDLTATNLERIKMAFEKNACNGIIIKPNQIGTVTETLEAAKLAKSYGWKIMVSNRAGETEDDFIADLAVGLGAEFIKSGAPFPKERMAKYNRLVKIEEELFLFKTRR